MNGPLVSVVVSTRNRCALLVASIEALLAQQTDGYRFEVLVVDNNSSDDTRSVVRAYERRSGGAVRYVFEGREGVSHGRNAGIAVGRGPIVAFTDDDIRVAPGWLASAVRLLLEHPSIDYVGGPVLPCWAADPPPWLTRDHWSPLAAVEYSQAAFEVPAARAVCLIAANLFIRRTALDRVGWFDPAFRRCQDHDLMLRLWAAGLAGLYAPEVEATTVVPVERLTRGYHRRWHRTHGQFVARMPLRERWVNGQWAVEPASRGRFFLGVPLFEYRALLTHVWMWLRDLAARRANEAFAHELRIRYSLSFIVTSMRPGAYRDAR